MKRQLHSNQYGLEPPLNRVQETKASEKACDCQNGFTTQAAIPHKST